VKDALERVSLGVVEDRWDVPGSALLLGQAAHALLLEGVEGIVNGPDDAPDPGGDRGRA
jgi:hypothetical protein